MNYYFDVIHRNHGLSEYEPPPSSPSNKILSGGKDKQDLKTIPTGCFPPIYKIKKETTSDEQSKDKTRAFAQLKTALSLKDIMETRRDSNSKLVIS